MTVLWYRVSRNSKNCADVPWIGPAGKCNFSKRQLKTTEGSCKPLEVPVVTVSGLGFCLKTVVNVVNCQDQGLQHITETHGRHLFTGTVPVSGNVVQAHPIQSSLKIMV